LPPGDKVPKASKALLAGSVEIEQVDLAVVDLRRQRRGVPVADHDDLVDELVVGSRALSRLGVGVAGHKQCAETGNCHWQDHGFGSHLNLLLLKHQKLPVAWFEQVEIAGAQTLYV
jgi:hypothetical protein